MSDHRREPGADENITRPFRLLVVLATAAALLGPGLADLGTSPSPSAVPTAAVAERSPGQVPPEQVLTTSVGDSPVVGDVLQIPSIDLEASLVDVALGTNGVLSPPSDIDLIGRWNDSAKVGDTAGQSVLAGHTVSSGAGVMNRLGEVEIGDRVRATDDGMAVDYVITSIEKYSRAEIAEYSQALFGQDRPANRLVLVTCADYSPEGIYLSNIVVLAYPVRRA